VPDTGYHFVSWSDGVATAARTDTNVVANKSVTANFASDSIISTYTIVASAGVGGSISPSDAVTVNSGDNQKFVIMANNGYHIEDVLIDGHSVGAVSSYTFRNVTGDHTITVIFSRGNQFGNNKGGNGDK
jgi:hypothetical protein